MEQRHASYITPQLALAWAQQPLTVQPAEWAHRLSVVRTFARHRSATDPRTQIPPEGLLPYRAKRAQPYLYSAEEIENLLHAALSLPAHGGATALDLPLPVWIAQLSQGMRLGEARNLELQDVDLGKGVLTIRGAKFGKSRLIPIHASTCRVLADYLTRRNRRWATRPVSSYLFVSNWGNRWMAATYTERSMRCLTRLVCAAQVDSHGPRIHDLRHRFAVMTLVAMVPLRRRRRATFAFLVCLPWSCPRQRHVLVSQCMARADARGDVPP